MARGIDIHPDVVRGLVPVLRESTRFESAHMLAELGNTFFGVAHRGLVASLCGYTPYDKETIEAVSLGIQAYEVLGANAGMTVPQEFILEVIANFGESSNFGLDLATTMDKSVRDLIANYPYLAQGLLDLYKSQAKDPSQRLADYALSGSAVMWAAHSEVDDGWRFEQLFDE